MVITGDVELVLSEETKRSRRVEVTALDGENLQQKCREEQQVQPWHKASGTQAKPFGDFSIQTTLGCESLTARTSKRAAGTRGSSQLTPHLDLKNELWQS